MTNKRRCFHWRLQAMIVTAVTMLGCGMPGDGPDAASRGPVANAHANSASTPAAVDRTSNGEAEKASRIKRKRFIPVKSDGLSSCVYQIAGWDKEMVRFFFGVPNSAITAKTEFENMEIWPEKDSVFRPEEVEQWVYSEPLGTAFVTFNKDGDVVRAVEIWCEF
jgi:hypothetical protein